MKQTILLIFLVFLTIIGSNQSFAQSDLQIFGFFQASLDKMEGAYSVVADVPPTVFGTSKLTLDTNSNKQANFQVQQINLFLRKELSESFTAWVNFQVTGNLNDRLGWGNFSLEEAWVNYQYSNLFNLRVGLLIPRFSYLNEIKNKLPLLPYLQRPLVYESSLDILTPSDYIPEKAYAQLFGYLPVGDFTLDYAAFVGPSENSYVTGLSGNPGGLSVDTSNFFLVGGRVGVKSGEFRFGFSATLDKDNQMATIKENVNRVRIAFDAGYSIANFFADAEYIMVTLDPKNSTADMNKLFYYGTLGYNFSEQLSAFGSYSFVKNESSQVLQKGMTGISVGIGYKPIESIVFKAGYSTFFSNNTFPVVLNPNLPPMNATADVDYKDFSIAVSVLF